MPVELYPAEKARAEFMAIIGEQLKLDGMNKTVKKHQAELAYVQGVARYLAGLKEIISIDDVRRQCAIDGHNWTLGNCAGAVFKSDEWEFCGFMVSERPSAHARVIRTWRLK